MHILGGFSAHAGQSDLLDWLSWTASAGRIAVVHGENGPRVALSEKIKERFALSAFMPEMREVIEI